VPTAGRSRQQCTNGGPRRHLQQQGTNGGPRTPTLVPVTWSPAPALPLPLPLRTPRAKQERPAPALHTDSLSSGANCIVAASRPCRVLLGERFLPVEIIEVLERCAAPPFVGSTPVQCNTVILIKKRRRVVRGHLRPAFSTTNLPREAHCHICYRALITPGTGTRRRALADQPAVPPTPRHGTPPTALQPQQPNDNPSEMHPQGKYMRRPQRACTTRRERVSRVCGQVRQVHRKE